MAKYILAIDQGTTGTTAMLLDKQLQVKAKSGLEFPQIFPRTGWVEHKVEDIWDSVQKAVEACILNGGISPQDIAAIGITNQRETVALWEKDSGKQAHNAIVWQCRRTTEICERLKAKGHEPLVRERTGLVLDPYFSGTKMMWLLEQVPEARQRTQAGEWLFGTIDSFLTWRLTGSRVHVTDVTNASRTQLMNLKTLDWDDDLLSIFQVPREALPKIVPSSGVVGHTKGLSFLPDGIPIAGLAGDQQAAMVGQACFETGSSKCTYGTGAFLLMNTGSEPVWSKNGLLTTVCWQVGSEVAYALEGSAFIAGAAVQWLRDGLGLIKKSADIEELAQSVGDSGGVTFVPALSGLGAPYWRPNARGIISGLHRGSTSAHLARATLEGIAFQINDLLNAMKSDSGVETHTLNVDGGASLNDLLMQIQADLSALRVERPKVIETTALGAAFLAGLAVSYWENRAEVKQAWQLDRYFEVQMREEERSEHLQRWAKAVEAC